MKKKPHVMKKVEKKKEHERKVVRLMHLPTVVIATIFSWLDVTNRQALRECSLKLHECAKMSLAACHRLVLNHSARSRLLPTRNDYRILRYFEIQGDCREEKATDHFLFYQSSWNVIAPNLHVLKISATKHLFSTSPDNTELFPLFKQLHTLTFIHHRSRTMPLDLYSLSLWPSLTCLHLPLHIVTAASLTMATFPLLTDLCVAGLDVHIKNTLVFPNLLSLRLTTTVDSFALSNVVADFPTLVTVYPSVTKWSLTNLLSCPVFRDVTAAFIASTITHLVLECCAPGNDKLCTFFVLQYLPKLEYLELHNIEAPLLPILETLREYVYYFTTGGSYDSLCLATGKGMNQSLSATTTAILKHSLQMSFPNLETLRCSYQQHLTTELAHVPKLKHLHMMETPLTLEIVKKLVSGEGRTQCPQLEYVSTSTFTLCLTGATSLTFMVPLIAETFLLGDNSSFTPHSASLWNSYLRPHRPAFL